MFGNALAILCIPFVLSTIYFGLRKGENNYYDSDKYDGNGTAHYRRIVIFGATGDLCKKKLIPALFELWKKKLLPENILIVGASRRDLPKETWLQKLGDYPQEFTTWLDFARDLDCQESLSKLHDDSADTTYFYLSHQRGMKMLSSISKKSGSLMTQITPAWLSRNPLGTILNLLVLYSLWWSGIYARNKYFALTIISAKILLIISLPPALAIFYWNHFGTGST